MKIDPDRLDHPDRDLEELAELDADPGPNTLAIRADHVPLRATIIAAYEQGMTIRDITDLDPRLDYFETLRVVRDYRKDRVMT